jgi:plastocyanin
MMRPASLLLLLATAHPARAADLTVEVEDSRGSAVSEAVVYAVPEGRTPSSPPSKRAVMDQKNRTFVPHVLAIQTGTAVTFPNSDNVRHQVYSFSPAKKFQLPLYAGTPAEPVVFDKPGVVALGCNIHDQMSAYVVVVDTPYLGVTADGRATLTGLPAGRYHVHVWHSGVRHGPEPLTVSVAADERKAVTFELGAR